MQIEPLGLSHQELLEQKFRELNLPLSEYTFPNLYLFREVHRYQVLKLSHAIFIKGVARDGTPFIMPTSPPLLEMIELLRSPLLQNELVYPIPETWLPYFEKFLLQASFKEEESDYLFTASKLATYPGRHLSKKRNLVKQLVSHHEVKGKTLDNQLNDAQTILEKWAERKGDTPDETDFNECLEAIQKFHLLHLSGRIVYVDGKPAGFTIGERLSKDCYTIHFCKGLSGIKGLYQYLYQDAAQSLKDSYRWINLEQDLGIPALRDAKHSYSPDQSLLKWRLKLR